MSAERNRDGCPHAESVSLHVLNALPASEAAEMREHLKVCEACRGDHDSLQSAVALLAESWPSDLLAPSESLWGRLVERTGAPISIATPTANAPAWTDPEWEEVGPGISCKLLSEDSHNHRVSMLVRLAPNAAYPAHRHAGTEELHLLQGELWIDGRKLYAGDYYHAKPGSSDSRVWSETGCTCVLMTSARDVLR